MENNWGPYFTESSGQVSSPQNSPDTETVPNPADYNLADSISSTENFLQNELQPESSQQGLPALSNPLPYAGYFASGCTNPTSGQGYYNWSSGTVGVTGSKFS